MSLYSATKAAQVGFIEALRTEFLDASLHASVIYPITTPTEFHSSMRRDFGHAVDAHGPRQTVGRGRGGDRRLHRLAAAGGVPVSQSVVAGGAVGRSRRRAPTGSCRNCAAERSSRNDLGGHLPHRRGGSRCRRARAARRRLRPRRTARAAAEGRRSRGVRHPGRSAPRDPRAIRARRDCRRSFAVFKVVIAASRDTDTPARIQQNAVDVSLPRRESKTGRGHKGFLGRRRSASVVRRGGAAAGLHDQRDLARSADERDRRSVRRPPRPARSPACASSIRRRFGDDSLRVLRALQFAARFELTVARGDASDLPIDPARRSPGRAHLDARSKNCCCRRDGRRSAWRSRSTSASSIGCGRS